MKGVEMDLVGKTCRVSRVNVNALGCPFSEHVKMNTRQLLRVIVTVGLLVTARHVAFGEERTVQAMAPWQGSGEVFVVAPEKLMILASFTGIMYLQGTQGALDGVVMLCPAVQTLDTKAKRAEASGHCTLTGAGDDVVYSAWTCTGVQGTCEGEFTLTGGTGKFAGIAGGGKLMVRAALGETAASLSSGGVVRAAAGLAIWPELKYTIPAR
jgi:hypothetical protein